MCQRGEKKEGNGLVLQRGRGPLGSYRLVIKGRSIDNQQARGVEYI